MTILRAKNFDTLWSHVCWISGFPKSWIRQHFRFVKIEMQNRTSGHLHSLNKKRGVVEFPNYTISWSTHWIPSGFPREWSFEDRAWSSTAIVILALQTTATSEPKSWYPGGQKGESICQTYTTPTVQVRNIVATVGRKSELKAVHGACHLPMTTPRRLYSSGKPTENNAGIG